MKGVVFCSYWNTHSGYGLALDVLSVSAKTTICRIIEHLVTTFLVLVFFYMVN